MYDYAVLIGRFQPFHNAHLQLLREALKISKNLIIVIGSADQPRTVKNPWTANERQDMILGGYGDMLEGDKKLTEKEYERITFVLAKDYLYNNMLWVAAVQEKIDEITGGSRSIKLIGHRKDASSFYLNSFPQWGEYVEVNVNGSQLSVDATKVRDLMFRQDKIGIKSFVPPTVYKQIVEFMDTDEFDRLHGEYHDVQADKAAWHGAPYQPTFVTTDAVVICSGHVLVVRRRGKYGKGLIALPGGYIKAEDMLIDNCIRELKEETGIKVPAKDLKDAVCDKDVFDHPGRDLRGRVITHAYCIKLPDGELPRVKGMDDADKAWWYSLRDVFANESKFFADHYHIINRFVQRY